MKSRANPKIFRKEKYYIYEFGYSSICDIVTLSPAEQKKTTFMN
jgi:hypothetical protein